MMYILYHIFSLISIDFDKNASSKFKITYYSFLDFFKPQNNTVKKYKTVSGITL